MHDWLGYAIKHQYQPYACIKQHAEPSPGAEFRFAIRTTQPNVFKTTKPKVDAKQKDDIHRHHIKPTEFSCDKCLCGFKKCAY